MRSLRNIVSLLLLTCGLIPTSSFAEIKDLTSRPADMAPTVSGISFSTLEGRPLPLSDYAGKAILIVNTASKCGFTPQYAQLEELYETYKDRGLVVIAVPSNDFGNQEPGDAKTIRTFVQENYKITFPITSKQAVSGPDPHPFFQMVRSQMGVFATPKWNFYKYLITPEGKLAGWWSSKTEPSEKEFRTAIEAVLPKK